MSVRRIIFTKDTDSGVLRGRAAEVTRFDAGLRRLVADMVDTMREAPGVGLAAPQVGVAIRVLVMEPPPPEGEEEPDEGAPSRVVALVNPEVRWRSGELVEDQEACLSIPGLYGDVPRHTAIHVAGRDPSGAPLELELADYAARILQHELDHLDGVLFPDRVTALDKLYRLRQLPDGSYEREPFSGGF
jgi:peptide deformylase